MFGFQVTEEDVANVLRRQWTRVTNTDGVPFDVMGEQLFMTLDADQIERVALKHSCDLDEQTDAAMEEIDRQLVAQGVLRPVAECASH